MLARFAALVAGGVLSTAPFHTTLTAPGHTPAVNEKWNYSLRVADRRGKPLKATLTAQIVDPFGGIHPVEFGDTHRFVVAFPFTGVFRDFIRFPPDSKGFRLTVRFIVKAKGAKTVLTYWIKAK
jgi:hypothetical protein